MESFADEEAFEVEEEGTDLMLMLATTITHTIPVLPDTKPQDSRDSEWGENGSEEEDVMVVVGAVRVGIRVSEDMVGLKDSVEKGITVDAEACVA